VYFDWPVHILEQIWPTSGFTLPDPVYYACCFAIVRV